MRFAVALFLVMTVLNAFASDSKECTGAQASGYETSVEIMEDAEAKGSKILYITSGSARKLYLRLETPAVDSRTLGTIEQDVTGHFTKKSKGITCFKQEVETQECAIYSCNLKLQTEPSKASDK